METTKKISIHEKDITLEQLVKKIERRLEQYPDAIVDAAIKVVINKTQEQEKSLLDMMRAYNGEPCHKTDDISKLRNE
ncbi:hypothetical protein HON22_05365 [Candidatus Peregrinibacteria bacterium]|jgi:hypothetical protein|nr:hypothetical protein [Candidatus Peregrinibacteria bacterium]